MSDTLPISAVIATKDRPEVLLRALQSLWAQQPGVAECIVVDASSDRKAHDICAGFDGRLKFLNASTAGAAEQRNEGVEQAQYPHILFLDDDIIIERDCLRRLWEALQSNPRHGGASAMISNQHYQPPGRLSRLVFAWLHGQALESYAGRCLGPGLAQLPADDAGLPDIVPVDWLNAGFTIYRREALPDPPFPPVFHGASTAEDLALSLRVAKSWTLVNARRARIFHDSQPGAHKRSVPQLAAMELVNRHYIMRSVLGKTGPKDYIRLIVMMAFQFAGTLSTRQGRRHSSKRLAGYGIGLFRILRTH